MDSQEHSAKNDLTEEQRAAPPPGPAIANGPGSSTAYETCEQCAAPVEATQRYCVDCGTRRKHVDDPAARFMSTATSRARRATRAQQGAGAQGQTPRGAGLGLALAIALIPAGIGLGVVIGGSSGGNPDAAWIAALKAQKQPVINLGGGSSAAVTASPTSTGKSANKKSASGAAAQSSSSGGQAAAGYKPSSANLAAGAQVVSKVSKAVGKSYVGSQSGLPNVVSVP